MKGRKEEASVGHLLVAVDFLSVAVPVGIVVVNICAICFTVCAENMVNRYSKISIRRNLRLYCSSDPAVLVADGVAGSPAAPDATSDVCSIDGVRALGAAKMEWKLFDYEERLNLFSSVPFFSP